MIHPRSRSKIVSETIAGPAFDVVYEMFTPWQTNHYPVNSAFYHWYTMSGMTDVVGGNGSINPVDHIVGENFVRSLLDFYQPDGGHVHFLGDTVPMLPNLALEWGDGLIPPTEASTISNWSTEALNAFSDQVPEIVSVANFLYELKDIKGLIPKIEKSLVRTAGSNFLALEFGLKPFLGDIQKLQTIQSAVEKRLKHLRSTAGKTVSLRFKRSMEKPTNVNFTREGHYFNNYLGGNFLRFELEGYSGEFNVTGKLFQNLEGLNDPFTNLKALAAATGFNNPAAIVWEAIPYSFVVDWFISLDKQIDKLAIQPFGGEYRVTDVCWSTKESFNWLVYQDFFPNDTRNKKRLIGNIVCKYYKRRPGFPVAGLNFQSLSPKQLALSLALLEQRR